MGFYLLASRLDSIAVAKILVVISYYGDCKQRNLMVALTDLGTKLKIHNIPLINTFKPIAGNSLSSFVLMNKSTSHFFPHVFFTPSAFVFKYAGSVIIQHNILNPGLLDRDLVALPPASLQKFFWS